MSFTRFALIVLFMVSTVVNAKQSNQVKCYQCNSTAHPDCFATETLREEYLKECPNPMKDGHKSIGCWKLFQKVDYDEIPTTQDLKAHQRVFRLCAHYEPENRDRCTMPKTSGPIVQQCFCNTTACNSGSRVTATLLLLSLSLSGTFLITNYY